LVLQEFPERLPLLKTVMPLSIELELLNTPQGGSHPAHIHLNNAADGGDINIKAS
jgi:hypothetical protein